MVINFRAHEISRGTRKLVWTLMLINNNNKKKKQRDLLAWKYLQCNNIVRVNFYRMVSKVNVMDQVIKTRKTKRKTLLQREGDYQEIQ